mgnify:CR=1 FL=1
MELDVLTAISPIDGRYRGKTKALAAYFSEFALIKYRVQVEVEYFITLCELPLPQLKGIDSSVFETLRNIYRNFSEADAQRIKDIESVTNHDVKAVEYFLKEEFEQAGELYISTEDGSVGTKGNVMDAIREQSLDADIIFACGPTPMLRAIKAYAEEKKIECYISLEERMACGIGACLACVCKTKEKDAHSNVNNKRICKDGPVFLSTEVDL